jgi:hypothetical protein
MAIQDLGNLQLAYLGPRDSDSTGSREPKELWLQNLAIAIEIIFPAIALIVCILRGYIRIVSRSIGWGTPNLLVQTVVEGYPQLTDLLHCR